MHCVGFMLYRFNDHFTDRYSFSSFVESHGQPLLDLSLYVSSENYTHTTRPLYNTIQPFPLPYLTPNSVRAAAKLRTEHLGFHGLDIDADESRNQHSIIPESLRTARSTVSSLLAASPEAQARIRLDSLARNFLEPLQDLRGPKKFLTSNDQFSSLDCLVLGYLSLMLIPDVPQPWLSKTMRANFPSLCAWTEEQRTKVFGAPVTPKDALLGRNSGSDNESGKKASPKSSLPWKAPQDRTVTGVSQSYLAALVDSIPLLGQLRRTNREIQLSDQTARDKLSAPFQVATVLAGVIASNSLLAGYMFQTGAISLRPQESENQKGSGLDAFGDAGAALSMYANHMDAEVQRQKILESESSP